MAVNEDVVVRNAQKGDIEAFEAIVDQYQKMIYNLSYKMLGNPDDACEASQEIFIRIYKSIGKFKFDSKFSTWIYRIATNFCLDIIRSSKTDTVYIEKPIETDDGEIVRDIADGRISLEDTVLRSEKVEIVRKAVVRLQPGYRIAVILRDIQGYSYSEISEILDLPEGTVKSRINRGRQELKEILENDKELFSEYSVKTDRRGGI
jgi:RNA polymerase sigma-70 factor, ECF subfamily